MNMHDLQQRPCFAWYQAQVPKNIKYVIKY